MSTSVRNQAVDLARGVALVGILINHTLYFTHPTLVAALGDFSAIAFTFLSGVSMMAFGGSEDRLKTVVRALCFIVVGLLLGTLNPAVDVILVNFGIILLLAALILPRIRPAWLLRTGIAWLLLAPPLTFLARQAVRLDHPENIGFSDLADNPLALLLRPVLYSSYPVAVWMGVFLVGAGWACGPGRHVLMGDMGSGREESRVEDRKIVGRRVVEFTVLALLLKWIGARIGMNFMPLRDSLERTVTLGSGMVDTWQGLLQAQPYTATALSLGAGCATSVALIYASSLVTTRGSLLAVLGGATFSAYTIHCIAHVLVPASVRSAHSEIYLVGTLLMLAVLAWAWKRSGKGTGPLELMVARLVRIEQAKRQPTLP